MASTGFYRGNSLNSIGEQARLMLAPFVSPAPTQLAHLMSMTTYDPNATYGFVDIGLTNAPLTMSVQADTNNWDNQQYGRYRVVPTMFHGALGTTALEYTQANRVMLMGATAATDPTTNEHRTNWSALVALPLYRAAAVHLDPNGWVHATVYPRVQWDGGAIQTTLARGDQLGIPFTFAAMVDDQLIDPTTKQGLYRYDFDQF